MQTSLQATAFPKPLFLHDSALPSVAATLMGAYNRAYLAPCLRHFTQIPLRGTSDTLGTLGDIIYEKAVK